MYLLVKCNIVIIYGKHIKQFSYINLMCMYLNGSTRYSLLNIDQAFDQINKQGQGQALETSLFT